MTDVNNNFRHNNPRVVAPLRAADTTKDFPNHRDRPTRYLKRDIGRKLARCLKDVCEVRPADPIEYIAHWLYKSADAELYYYEKVIFNKECQLLVLEFQRMQVRKSALIQQINDKMKELKKGIKGARFQQREIMTKRLREAQLDIKLFKPLDIHEMKQFDQKVFEHVPHRRAFPDLDSRSSSSMTTGSNFPSESSSESFLTKITDINNMTKSTFGDDSDSEQGFKHKVLSPKPTLDSSEKNERMRKRRATIRSRGDHGSDDTATMPVSATSLTQHIAEGPSTQKKSKIPSKDMLNTKGAAQKKKASVRPPAAKGKGVAKMASSTTLVVEEEPIKKTETKEQKDQDRRMRREDRRREEARMVSNSSIDVTADAARFANFTNFVIKNTEVTVNDRALDLQHTRQALNEVTRDLGREQGPTKVEMMKEIEKEIDADYIMRSKHEEEKMHILEKLRLEYEVSSHLKARIKADEEEKDLMLLMLKNNRETRPEKLVYLEERLKQEEHELFNMKKEIRELLKYKKAGNSGTTPTLDIDAKALDLKGQLNEKRITVEALRGNVIVHNQEHQEHIAHNLQQARDINELREHNLMQRKKDAFAELETLERQTYDLRVEQSKIQRGLQKSQDSKREAEENGDIEGVDRFTRISENLQAKIEGRQLEIDAAKLRTVAAKNELMGMGKEVEQRRHSLIQIKREEQFAQLDKIKLQEAIEKKNRAINSIKEAQEKQQRNIKIMESKTPAKQAKMIKDDVIKKDLEAKKTNRDRRTTEHAATVISELEDISEVVNTYINSVESDGGCFEDILSEFRRRSADRNSQISSSQPPLMSLEEESSAVATVSDAVEDNSSTITGESSARLGSQQSSFNKPSISPHSKYRGKSMAYDTGKTSDQDKQHAEPILSKKRSKEQKKQERESKDLIKKLSQEQSKSKDLLHATEEEDVEQQESNQDNTKKRGTIRKKDKKKSKSNTNKEDDVREETDDVITKERHTIQEIEHVIEVKKEELIPVMNQLAEEFQLPEEKVGLEEAGNMLSLVVGKVEQLGEELGELNATPSLDTDRIGEIKTDIIDKKISIKKIESYIVTATEGQKKIDDIIENADGRLVNTDKLFQSKQESSSEEDVVADDSDSSDSIRKTKSESSLSLSLSDSSFTAVSDSSEEVKKQITQKEVRKEKSPKEVRKDHMPTKEERKRAERTPEVKRKEEQKERMANEATKKEQAPKEDKRRPKKMNDEENEEFSTGQGREVKEEKGTKRDPKVKRSKTADPEIEEEATKTPQKQKRIVKTAPKGKGKGQAQTQGPEINIADEDNPVEASEETSVADTEDTTDQQSQTEQQEQRTQNQPSAGKPKPKKAIVKAKPKKPKGKGLDEPERDEEDIDEPTTEQQQQHQELGPEQTQQQQQHQELGPEQTQQQQQKQRRSDHHQQQHQREKRRSERAASVQSDVSEIIEELAHRENSDDDALSAVPSDTTVSVVAEHTAEVAEVAEVADGDDDHEDGDDVEGVNTDETAKRGRKKMIKPKPKPHAEDKTPKTPRSTPTPGQRPKSAPAAPVTEKPPARRPLPPSKKPAEKSRKIEKMTEESDEDMSDHSDNDDVPGAAQGKPGVKPAKKPIRKKTRVKAISKLMISASRSSSMQLKDSLQNIDSKMSQSTVLEEEEDNMFKELFMQEEEEEEPEAIPHMEGMDYIGSQEEEEDFDFHFIPSPEPPQSPASEHYDLECEWTLQDPMTLVCNHPLLGTIKARHKSSSSKSDAPWFWEMKKFHAKAFYHGEVYTDVPIRYERERIEAQQLQNHRKSAYPAGTSSKQSNRLQQRQSSASASSGSKNTF